MNSKWHVILTYTLYSLLSPATGWVFGWTNSSGHTQFESGTKTEYRSCTRIQQAKGELIDWESEEQPVCWQIYRDENCKSSGGHACHMLSKSASDNFAAYSVYPRDSSITVTSTFASTKASDTTSSTSEESSSTSTSPATSSSIENAPMSSKSLSGGAIAGLVIGLVTGVAVVAVLAYFLVRRRRASATEKGHMKSSTAPPSTISTACGLYLERNSPTTNLAIASSQPTAELHGNSAPVEMSDSHRILELETPGTWKMIHR